MSQPPPFLAVERHHGASGQLKHLMACGSPQNLAAQIQPWRICITHRRRAAGKDDSAHVGAYFGHLVERVDLTIYVEFPDPPADELSHLRAEVQNDNFFCHNRLEVKADKSIKKVVFLRPNRDDYARY